jgi:hypothetical protein
MLPLRKRLAFLVLIFLFDSLAFLLRASVVGVGFQFPILAIPAILAITCHSLRNAINGSTFVMRRAGR